MRRDVLTLQFAVKNVSGRRIDLKIRFRDIYYVDIENRKKYFGLRDEKGMYIAGPVRWDWDGGTFDDRIQPGRKALLWIKFPAPPENAKEIDIYLPGFLPFEGLELKK